MQRIGHDALEAATQHYQSETGARRGETGNMTDDQHDLKAWAEQGDQDAFASLSQRYAGLMHGICLRILRRDDLAADAEQAVLLLLARNASALSSRSSIAGWIVVTSRYVALHALRAETRRQKHEHAAGKQSMPQTHTEQQPVGDMSLHLDEGLSKLPEHEREAIVLRHIIGLEWSDIASQLKLKRNTIEKRVSRGLNRLRSHLSRQTESISHTGIAVMLGQLPVAAPGMQSLSAGIAAGKASATAQTLAQSAGSITGPLGILGSAGLIKSMTAAALVVAVSCAAWLASTHEADNPPPVQEQSVSIVDDTEDDMHALEPPGEDRPPAPEQRPPLIIHHPHTADRISSIACKAADDGSLIATFDMFKDELRIWDGSRPDRLLYAAEGGFSAVAFSADNTQVATLEFRSDHALNIWSWPEMQLLQTIDIAGKHQNNAFLEFLDNSQRLVVSSSDKIVMYDIDKEQQSAVELISPQITQRKEAIEKELQKLNLAMMANALNPQHTKKMRERKAELTLEKMKIGSGSKYIQALISSDDQYIVGLDSMPKTLQTPVICNAENGMFLRQCEAFDVKDIDEKRHIRNNMCLSPDGSTIAATYSFMDKQQNKKWTLTLWDLASGRIIQHQTHDSDSAPRNMVFLNNEALALSILQNRQYHLFRWSVSQSKLEPIEALQGMNVPVCWPLDATHKRLAVGDWKGPMHIYDTEQQSLQRWQLTDQQQDCSANSIALGPNSQRVATVSDNCHVALWDLKQARLQQTTQFGSATRGFSWWVHCAFAADGRSLNMIHGGQRNHRRVRFQAARWYFDEAHPRTADPITQIAGSPYAGVAVNQRWGAIIDVRAVRRIDFTSGQLLQAIPLPLPKQEVQPPFSPDICRMARPPLQGHTVNLLPPFAVNLANGTVSSRKQAAQSQTIESPNKQWTFITDKKPAWTHTKDRKSKLLNKDGAVVHQLPACSFASFNSDSTALLVQTVPVRGQTNMSNTGHSKLFVIELPEHYEPEHALTVHTLSADRRQATKGWSTYGSHLDVTLLPGGRGLLCGQGQGLFLIDVTSDELVMQFRAWNNGDWLIMSKDGYYKGSQGIERRLHMLDDLLAAAKNKRVEEFHKPENIQALLEPYLSDAESASPEVLPKITFERKQQKPGAQKPETKPERVDDF